MNGTLPSGSSTNASAKLDIVMYAEAGFNMLFGGDGNLHCAGTDPNPSGPPGSVERSVDCLGLILPVLERLGLKLAMHPSDVMPMQPTEPSNASALRALGGAMGGVTSGGPGDWAISTPEVERVVKELTHRNLSQTVAQIFFHDDEIGDSQATTNSVRWLMENAPHITPQVNVGRALHRANSTKYSLLYTSTS